MESNHLQTLMEHPLFDGIPAETLAAVLGHVPAVRVPSGSEIPHPEERWMALVLHGHAKVYSSDTARQVLLRTIGKGDLIGIAQLFAESAPRMSRMVADRETELLWLDEAAVRRLLDASPRFRDNCLAFLAERIAFLNRKIAAVTAGSAERRLALMLDRLADGQDTFLLSISMQSLADTLDISRASLYRALETLEQDGFLTRTGKQFRLTDRPAMLARYH